MMCQLMKGNEVLTIGTKGHCIMHAMNNFGLGWRSPSREARITIIPIKKEGKAIRLERMIKTVESNIVFIDKKIQEQKSPGYSKPPHVRWYIELDLKIEKSKLFKLNSKLSKIKSKTNGKRNIIPNNE